MSEVSIIIRSRNEEKWITSCLEAISKQTVKDCEIILVDNNSSDKTVQKAEQFGLKIINYESDVFKPGYAINKGIRASTGKFIAIISAHCIPVNDRWIENLLRNFDEPDVAGVYGRQEPLPYTSDLDKRDLINVFGLDRKIQKKDPFFHNANSMIRREVWEKHNFDDDTLHIEDRIWAQEILKKNHTIIYDPEASVYHYHGINQGRNISRAKRIVQILERIHENSDSYKIEGLNIVSIIPSRGKPRMLNSKPLVERAIDSVIDSKLLNKIIVATDNKSTFEIAEKKGVYPLLRPKELSYSYVGLVQVYQYVLDLLAKEGDHPDLVVLLEEKYPFRSPDLVNRMIEGLLHGGYDSVIAVCREYGSLWRSEGDELVRVDEGMVPSRLKNPLYRGLIGLGCVTHPSFLYNGNKLGEKVGLINIENDREKFSFSSEMDRAIAETIEK